MRLSGEFDRHFLASIFQLISDQMLTGILQLNNAGQKACVFIHDGQVINSPGGENRRRLGEWFSKAGIVDADRLPALIKDAQAAGCGLGTLLIRKGMLTPDELKECLAKQTQELIWDAFNWQQGTFEFQPRRVDVSSKTVIHLDIQALILDSLRRYDEAVEGEVEKKLLAGKDIPECLPDLEYECAVDLEDIDLDDIDLVDDKQPTIRVLVVEDSRLMRKGIVNFLDNCDGISVVGEAVNGQEAIRLNDTLNPDLITLDICMPVMDGLTALGHIMIRNPKPVVMLSSMTRDGAVATFEALRLGAADFVGKPVNNAARSLETQFGVLAEKIRLASQIDRASLALLRPTKNTQVTPEPRPVTPGQRMVVGATAEGGYRAILKILTGLQVKDAASMVVSIQSSPQQVDTFSDYLGRFSALSVQRPQNGQCLEANTCYLVANTERVTVARQSGHLCFKVSKATVPSGRQAVPLMTSVAESLGKGAIGLVLSGNTHDCTTGLRVIKAMGGTAIAQDPDGCQYAQAISAAIDSSVVDVVMTEMEIAHWIGNNWRG